MHHVAWVRLLNPGIVRILSLFPVSLHTVFNAQHTSAGAYHCTCIGLYGVALGAPMTYGR